MRNALVAIAIAALLPGAAAAAPGVETAPGEFRIEFQATRQPGRTVVEGYVHSPHTRATDRMVLRVERLDAAGHVVGASRTWVMGGTPPGGRAYFSARVAEAAAYRVLVESFDWQRCGDG